MRTRPRRWCSLLGVALLALVATSAPALAQDTQSGPVAKDLAQLLDQQKLDSVAAKDASAADVYVAALYFPGNSPQLLVISAKYSVPVLLNDKLAKKDYKDVYVDLNSASDPKSRCFIVDLGADGLKAKPGDNQPFDTFEAGTAKHDFNGDWKKQKMSEDDYMKAFADADARYAKMLRALVAQLKKTS